MKNLILIFVVAFSSMALAQDPGTVSGHILDEESLGEPLLYANVEIKALGLTTQTNLHGNFQFADVAPGTYEMVVSYLGYEAYSTNIEVHENSITEINAALKAKTITLDLETLLSENSAEEAMPQITKEKK